MIPAFSRTFDEYVSWMASNAPNATVLDSWTRLERALQEYATFLDLPDPRLSRAQFDQVIGGHDHLGPDHTASLRQLRHLHDGVAYHRHTVSAEEARGFAVDVLTLASVVAQRLTRHERRSGPLEPAPQGRTAPGWWRPAWAPR